MSYIELLQSLSNSVGDIVVTHPDTLAVAARDESSFAAVLPLAVVVAHTTEDVIKTVKWCNSTRTPITARGAGSALEGNTIPSENGIVLDLSEMNNILEVDVDNLQAVVEPGVIYDKLNERLRKDGLFFPPSPGGSADVATIGGMVATNASGIYSVKYGGTREHVLELEAVTGAGDLVTFGNRCVKRSSGYNFTDFLSGSEGTLAIVTRVTLRLKGLPQAKGQSAFRFPTETAAVAAIAEMMRYGLDLAAVEYLGESTVRAVNKLRGYGIVEQPLLFLEAHGSDASVAETLELAASVAESNEGEPLTLPAGQDPWEVRHYTTPAIKLYRDGWQIIRNDVGFPVAQLPQVVGYVHEQAARLRKERNTELELFTLGHCGMGVLHALMLADPNDEASWGAGMQLNKLLKEYVLTIGGTLSGEHGIGLGHKDLFPLEHGEVALSLMRSIRKVFDPNGILNPGKIFD
ncbi:MAG: FAD-binding oxidoreductase [bacterium]|nr:FAD-binding oxidoreductase [bacterium]